MARLLAQLHLALAPALAPVFSVIQAMCLTDVGGGGNWWCRRLQWTKPYSIPFSGHTFLCRLVCNPAIDAGRQGDMSLSLIKRMDYFCIRYTWCILIHFTLALPVKSFFILFMYPGHVLWDFSARICMQLYNFKPSLQCPLIIRAAMTTLQRWSSSIKTNSLFDLSLHLAQLTAPICCRSTSEVTK